MFSESFAFVLVKRRRTKKSVAQALGIHEQSLYRKCTNGYFTEKEMQEIADALNCDLNITLTLRDTGETF